MNKLKYQEELERIYDKNQLTRRVKDFFKEQASEEFYKTLEKYEIPEAFAIDAITQMAIHKRATVSTLVGCLRHHTGDDQETANLLEKCVNAKMFSYSDRDSQFIVRFDIPSSLQKELDKFQYPLPMVIPPRAVNTNLETGYLNQKSSIILKDNHHDDDVCLDHINRINRTKLAVNLETAKAIQNTWKGLDRMRTGETWEDFQKRRKAFQKYDSVAKDIMQLMTEAGNELYLTHKYDKRGRTYCSGFHINYQGTDWSKATIELADREVLVD